LLPVARRATFPRLLAPPQQPAVVPRIAAGRFRRVRPFPSVPGTTLQASPGRWSWPQAGFRGLAWHFATLPQPGAGRASVLPTASRTPRAPAGALPRRVAARDPARASAVQVLPAPVAVSAWLDLV